MVNKKNSNGPYKPREDLLTHPRQEILPVHGAWEGSCGTVMEAQ